LLFLKFNEPGDFDLAAMTPSSPEIYENYFAPEPESFTSSPFGEAVEHGNSMPMSLLIGAVAGCGNAICINLPGGLYQGWR
jgi:hypothetical protein